MAYALTCLQHTAHDMNVRGILRYSPDYDRVPTARYLPSNLGAGFSELLLRI
jgi:hypothetical protein